MVKVRFYGEPKKKTGKEIGLEILRHHLPCVGTLLVKGGEGYIIYYLFLHHLLLNVGQNIGHGLRRPICIVSSRFPFFFSSKRQFKVGGAAGYSSPLSFCEQETKMRLLFSGVVFGQHAPSRRHERPHTCVGLCITFRWFVSSSIYSCFSFFFEDTDVSVFSLLCVVPSELDGDITEP